MNTKKPVIMDPEDEIKRITKELCEAKEELNQANVDLACYKECCKSWEKAFEILRARLGV